MQEKDVPLRVVGASGIPYQFVHLDEPGWRTSVEWKGPIGMLMVVIDRHGAILYVHRDDLPDGKFLRSLPFPGVRSGEVVGVVGSENAFILNEMYRDLVVVRQYRS